MLGVKKNTETPVRDNNINLSFHKYKEKKKIMGKWILRDEVIIQVYGGGEAQILKNNVGKSK